MNIILKSSNERKINEYKRYGLNFPVEKGEDLDEVLSNDYVTVIKYKALDAGINVLVEDTIVTVDGDVMVDFKWKTHMMNSFVGKEFKWRTSLAYNDGKEIYVVTSEVDCDVVYSDHIPEAFAIDPYIRPKGVEYTYHELELQGNKDKYSPRKMAIDKLLKNDFDYVISVNNIQPWLGKYQNT